MTDTENEKTQAQLIEELNELRQRVDTLVTSEAGHQQTEDELRISEDRWRSLTQSSPDHIMLLDLDYTIQFINYTVPGLTVEEVVGRSNLDFVPPNQQQVAGDCFARVIQSGEPDQYEIQYITAEGKIQYFDVRVAPVIDKDGSITGLINSANNITERKQIEHELQRSHGELEQRIEERTAKLRREISERKQAEEKIKGQQYYLEKAQELGQMGTWELDIKQNKLFWTDENCRIFGIPNGSVVNYEIFLEKIHPDDREYVDREWKAALKGKPYDIEHRLHADSITQWVREKADVAFDEEGVAVKAIGFTQDITDRKRMEEEIRKNQNLESLGLLAGGIAHDFNNVLTGVIGSLALLEILVDKDSDAHQIAVEGKRAADRTKDLTQQLLTFARGGAPVKEATSIAALIRETTELSLHGSNTKPAYHLAENLHSVHIDPGQIGQVLQNLVLNADQAMPEGGILKVSAENMELSAQDPLPLAAGDYVKVSVVDQGTGMSAEVMAKVFDPYFSTKTAGHGLGLSITYSIVQRHEGHIAVRSEHNVGTTFEFYLPALHEHTITAPDQKSELAHGSGRILLMDDEEMIHSTVAAMLKMLGYEVESVYDGEEALQAYQMARETDRPFDVVLVDLTIPGGMGGEEAVGKLLKIDSNARVIVSSGYTNDPIMAQFAEYGFVGMVRKPVDIQELAETVKRVLEERAELDTDLYTVLLVDDDTAILKTSSSLFSDLGYNVLTAEDGESAVAIYRERHAEIDGVVLDYSKNTA